MVDSVRGASKVQGEEERQEDEVLGTAAFLSGSWQKHESHPARRAAGEGRHG